MEAHWTHRWIGRQADGAAPDCAAFAALVARAEFGADVHLPAAPRDPRAWDATVVALSGAYARQVPEPRDGDGALMRQRGARGRARWHVGIAALAGGTRYVLHLPMGAASVLTAERDLPAEGLELEGWYRWA